MNIFARIREKSTPTVRKTIYTVFASVTTLASLILFFVPFCSYYTIEAGEGAYMPLTPLALGKLLSDSFAVQYGYSYLGLALFLLWLAYAFVIAIFFFRMLFRMRRPDEKIKKTAQRIGIANTLVTGLYFIGGVVFNFINHAFGGRSEVANNAFPMIIVLVADILLAIYLGILYAGVTEEETQPKLLPKKKLLARKKGELFLWATLLLLCTLASFFVKVISVEFAKEELATFNFSVSGFDLLKDHGLLGAESQGLVFILFAALVIVLSFYFVMILALCSKSELYFQLGLVSVVISGVACFIVGMCGKFYEILQVANIDTITSWLEYKIETLLPVSVNLTTLKDELLENCIITSSSFYCFLASLVPLGLLLIRAPYSKGISLERELRPVQGDMTAAIDSAEMDISTMQGVGGGAMGDGDCPDPCPAFSELDEAAATIPTTKNDLFEEPTLPKLVRFIVDYARESRLHLFYTEEDIATFVAGLGTTKLTILQGMSGTGKTSLPKIFTEALCSVCNIVEVESSWRDKNELLGYYNEFSKMYTPKKFTQALYRAALDPETVTFIVLDEMNLSRIEYYFSDFLSLMEHEPENREIKLLNVGLYQTKNGKRAPYKALKNGHTLKVPPNVWFIGTANRDESTFEISDKVYDRAHTMNFNKRAKKQPHHSAEIPKRYLSASVFNSLLEEAKKTVRFSVDDYPAIAKAEELLSPYNISFGNRIAMQIENFVSIYCACFNATEEVIHDAVERILLSKVVSKLELKSVENKDELARDFEDIGFRKCSEFIARLRED